MRKLLFIAFLGMLCLGLGLVLSCATGGDDDSRGRDDDDDTSVNDDTSADNDTSGNLTWQDPPSSAQMIWEDAISYCENLNFGGHDDWRLPTISELRSLIRGCDATETGGACTATDDCLDSTCWNYVCGGCYSLAGPGSGGAYWPDGMSGEIFWYWSSSPTANIGNYPWCVQFGHGLVDHLRSDGDYYARCVRP
jgi:hypothetical protein